MNESITLSEIRMEFNDHGRLFRNNTGMAWQGRILEQSNYRIVLENPRPLHAGLVKGGSDLIGWTRVLVTPEMIARELAIFTAFEVKHGNTKTTNAQINFIENVKQAGGIAGIVRSVEGVMGLVDIYRNS